MSTFLKKRIDPLLPSISETKKCSQNGNVFFSAPMKLEDTILMMFISFPETSHCLGGIPPSGNTNHQSVKVGGDRLKHLQYLQAAPAHEGSLAAAQTLPSKRRPLSLSRSSSQQATTAPCSQSWCPTDQAWPLNKLRASERRPASRAAAALL